MLRMGWWGDGLVLIPAGASVCRIWNLEFGEFGILLTTWQTFRLLCFLLREGDFGRFYVFFFRFCR